MNKLDKNIFGLITKSEDQEDGTIKVYGYASSPNADSDDEIITAEAMEKAFDNYMKFGAVREMHQSKTAGTAIEISLTPDGKTFFGAHVIDSEAVKKVKLGAYKGFSIGGKVKKRNTKNKNIIEEIDLIEISLVDRPANQDAVFTMFKAQIVDNNTEIGNNMDMNTQTQNTQEQEVVKQEQTEVITTETVEIKKGLGQVSWLASLISEMKYLHEDLCYERSWEKDNSKLPDDLLNIIKQLNDLLINSVKEETDELVVNAEDLTNTLKSANIEKYGSRNSKADKEKLKQIMLLCKELGCEDEESEEDEEKNKSKNSEDLNKAETLEKSLNENLEKVNKLEKEKEELTKRVKELENMPKPAKASILSINKSEDYVNAEDRKVEAVLKSDGKVDDVATLIKAAQMNPKRIY